MATCAWPDCDAPAAEGGPGFTVGRPPDAKVVQLCLPHQSMWEQMVATQRVDELYELFEDEDDGI
jgi:hypothetical protein